jgi:hypothetical protein
MSEIEEYIKRINDNMKYSEGLARSEEATGHTFTEAEISEHRRKAREFIKKYLE